MKTESRFDREASQWDNNPVRVQLARAVGEGIRGALELKSNWRVMDFGAGTGLVTLGLQPYVSSVVAVDMSAGMLEVLQQKIAAAGISNVETRQWNLESGSFPEENFDLVVSSMTMHHVRDVALVFRRLVSLLKRDGCLAIADLDSEDGSFHGQANDVFHHGFNRGELRKWMADAGFVNIDVKDVHTISKPNPEGRMRSYGVFLATGNKQ